MSLKSLTTRLPSFRRSMIYLHSWVGAIIFLILLLVTLTGLVITFSGDLMELEYAELNTVTPVARSEPLDLEALMQVAREGYGSKVDIAGLMMPHSRLQINAATFFGNPVYDPSVDTLLLAVDPYQTRYLTAIDIDNSWTAILIHLHGELLAGHTGAFLIAVVGLLTLLLIGTGLYLWLPARDKSLPKLKAKAVRFRWGKNPHAFSHYIHSFLGIWTVFFVFTWTLTGVYWSHPHWFNSVLPSPPRQPPAAMQTQLTQDCGLKVGLNQALATAQQRFPQREVARVFLPSSRGNYYSFAFKGDEDGNRFIGNATAWVSHQCESRVYGETFGESFGSEQLASWMISWHSGRFFGAGQIPVMLFVGLLFGFITVTGIVLWAYRHAKQLKPIGQTVQQAKTALAETLMKKRTAYLSRDLNNSE